MSTRSFLMLQGGATSFFRQLGRALSGAGHSVHRVNFCAGDKLFWGNRNASDFRETVDRLPALLDETWRASGVTDLIVFGDCRPGHRTAIDAAHRHRSRVHVFEEGYLRPGWITLERDGVNGYSRLPRDAAYYREAASRLPPQVSPHPAGESMLRRVGFDIAYHLANFLFSGRFPQYRNHRQDSAPMEYLGWAARFLSRPFHQAFRRAVLKRLAGPGTAYFLLPLQLSADTQIQFHSPFGSMSEAIDRVLGSFARSAPPEAGLVVKLHPLDPGLVSYRRHVAREAAALGIADRVLFIDGGGLNPLVRGARGVVTVNSTVGMAALAAGRPVFAMGAAVYAIAGLTFEGPLDRFWSAPTPPDAALVEDFLKVLVHLTQMRGNYYSRDGIDAAVAGSLARLTA